MIQDVESNNKDVLYDKKSTFHFSVWFRFIPYLIANHCDLP